jgi:hypothetical protein
MWNLRRSERAVPWDTGVGGSRRVEPPQATLASVPERAKHPIMDSPKSPSAGWTTPSAQWLDGTEMH